MHFIHNKNAYPNDNIVQISIPIQKTKKLIRKNTVSSEYKISVSEWGNGTFQNNLKI